MNETRSQKPEVRIRKDNPSKKRKRRPWSIFNPLDFSQRSYQKELLDRDDIPFSDIARNMKELEFINTHLGGHVITLEGFKKIFDQVDTNKKELIVCEIGCRGGDNLQVIDNWCKSKNLRAITIGIDMNRDCIEFAKTHTKLRHPQWINSDYRKISFTQKPDIIFNSLFCHHFNEVEMEELLRWMKHYAQTGFFINDLHRHPLAYHSIKWLSRIFSRSYLVKHDAPLSVLRGFKKDELRHSLEMAGIINYQIEWKWAFRWLVTYCNTKK